MNTFRHSIPSRRAWRKTCKHYQSYRNDLREDFNNRCWYCNDSDKFRIRNFWIDHFVPRNPKDFSHPIPDNSYDNLVYSCSSCNISKSNKWPTLNHEIHNDWSSWFIDPIDSSYSTMFKRNEKGDIICNWQNKLLADFIIKELRLYYPLHWLYCRIERLSDLEETVSEKIKTSWNKELVELHKEIQLELFQNFKTLFKENE